MGAIGEGNAAFFRGGHIRLKVNIWATHGPNTTKVPGRLMLTVLASMAEFEQQFIGIRTGEGRARQAYGQSSAESSPAAQRESSQRRKHYLTAHHLSLHVVMKNAASEPAISGSAPA